MKTLNYIPKIKIMLLALLVGLITGIISIVFNEILNFGFRLFAMLYTIKWTRIIAPIAIALFISFVRHYLLEENNQGFGVSQVMYEIEKIKRQMMKPLAVFYKIICTLLTLAGGFSAGRQGPIVHLGGAVGSNIAYHSNISEDATRVLIGCGVAGCMAGIFNSPIFATLFVIEILFKKRYFDMLSTILLSALSSTLVTRIFTDHAYFTNFQTNYSFHMSETISFIVFGVLLGFWSILYVQALTHTKKRFNKLKMPHWCKHVIGALCIGFALYFFSDYYFYNPTPSMISGEQFSATHLIIQSLILIGLTAITLSSGAYGGIFAPGLVIGLTFGLGLSKYFSFLGLPILDNSTYAIAGMAAMYAGFASAPLSAAIMVVELTQQYNLIFPMLICALIASKINELFIHDSIYHKNLDDLIHQCE